MPPGRPIPEFQCGQDEFIWSLGTGWSTSFLYTFRASDSNFFSGGRIPGSF